MRIYLAVALLWCGVPLLSQSWDAVAGLRAGEHVRVRDTGGQEVKGLFVRSSPDGITVSARGGDVSIERTRVRSVKVRSNSRRVRNIVIGAGIGLAVGIAIDNTFGVYLRNESSEDPAARAATYVGPTAIFGAIGALFPSYRTVYRIQ